MSFPCYPIIFKNFILKIVKNPLAPKRLSSKGKKMSESEIPNDILALLELTDGYSFRNIVDYLRCSNTEGNFIFSKNKITYKQHNAQSSLMNKFTIKACKVKYIFNAKNDILVGVQLQELQTHTKTISKKDGIRIYLKPDDPNVYIQILSTNKGSSAGNVNFVRTKEIELCDFSLPKFTRKNDEPNTIAVVGEFAKTCKTITSIKCDYVIFQGYPRGVKLSASLEGHIVGKAAKFGEIEDFLSGNNKYPDIRSMISNLPSTSNFGLNSNDKKKVKIMLRPQEGVPTIRAPCSVVQYLGKTNNTSQNGIIRIFLEEKRPLRILFPVGYYGKLVVLIRDQSVPIGEEESKDNKDETESQ